MRSKFWFESVKGRENSEEYGITIFKLILVKQSGKEWTVFIGLKTGTGGGNETPDATNGRGCLD
jgi:hypothetical protein